MKQTSRGLAPSLNTGHSTFTGARQRLAVALVAIFIAFAGAQTARAQTPCNIRFDISSGGTVKLQREGQWLEVMNGRTIPCLIPSVNDLIITPETGYYVSSVTYEATDGLRIDLIKNDDFHWYLNIDPYGGSETPTITVHIVFNKVGGADEASAVALTADDDFHLAGGWYKVESDLTLGHTVNLHGDTHIIIASGATLTVSTSGEYGIYGSPLTVCGEGTLNVSANEHAISVNNYTQTGCAVTLSGNNFGLNAENNVSISGGSLTTSGATYGIKTDNGAITISGGTVSSSGEQCGLFAAKAMNITGGTVSASGDNDGIRGLSVSITGGQVTASSGGIRSIFGDITLGWTSATDYITANGFTVEEGFYVKIADGQTLYGGGFPSASLTGTIGDPSALNGLMLRPTAAVTKSGTNEYTIRYADGWDAFCDRLAADDGKDFFSGKTVKLADDITVSRMAGSSDKPFTGTFNGQGKTLTVSYSGSSYVAPFSYVDGATIQNLVVEGTISSSGTRAAGVIGETGSPGTTGKSYITNCVSSSTITGGNYSGGFSIGGNVEIEGCVFNGIINSDGNSGGFVGYSQSALTITNSLFAPQSGSSAKGTFYYNGTAGTLTNCYYTQTLGEGQGKQARTIKAGENVTLGHDGVATEYSVSGITAYKASGASGDDDPFIAGIIYNNVLYAGSGEDVSLTLTNSSGDAPLGYYYPYSVSAGTISGSTLTMPDEDVTVSVNTAAPRSTGVAVPVSYVDAGGNTQTAQAIALDGTETGTVLGRNGEETWYFVGLPTVAFDLQLLILYDINLILADGCTMNVTSTDGRSCINVKNNLHIYGQAEGTGILNAQKQDEILSSDVIVIQDGTLRIHGGNVIATYNGTDKEKNAICFSRQENAGDVLVIDGGTLTANGNDGYGIFIKGGDACINGGQVTATGGNSGIAVSSTSIVFFQFTQQIPGTLTLSGGTLTASSIETFSGKDEGTIAVAPGYTYTDGSNIYDSTTASADLAALNDVTLWPYLALADAADNTAAITDHAGKTLAVALSGRTLYKDGSWNTLCLPFDVTVGGDMMEAATAMTLNASRSGFDSDSGVLTLYFDKEPSGNVIAAGTPFIVKWTGDDIVNPVFEGVTMSSTEAGSVTSTDGKVQFIGTYSPTDIYSAAKDNLYLGAGNTLYYPWGECMTEFFLNAFRAYFHVNVTNGVRQFVLNFGDEQTGIMATDYTDYTDKAGAWYTMEGVKLSGKPTARGVYIHGGRKVVIK